MTIFSGEDLLMLSGIQHIIFCERQWALIHIEQQWNENRFTAEGKILHERVDDFMKSESRGDVQFIRAVPLVSFQLGLYGKSDLVELHKTADEENAITIPGKAGFWNLIPIEYKRGVPKPTNCDILQLCAQAMCLEEMNHVHIPEGFMYYGMPHKRYQVSLDHNLRQEVREASLRMHDLFVRGHTPNPVYKKHCHSCSLFDICLPRSIEKGKDVIGYLENNLINSLE